MDITIREATGQDYTALCALLEQVDDLHIRHLPDIFCRSPGPVRERDYIHGLLSYERVRVFVAEHDGELLGLVHVGVRSTPPIPILVPRCTGYVEDLVVGRAFRRQGVGRALMAHADKWARGEGATTIELNVYAFNAGAICFYHALGYETLSHRMRRRLT